jgi:hypothetical protein
MRNDTERALHSISNSLQQLVKGMHALNENLVKIHESLNQPDTPSESPLEGTPS